MRRYLRNRRLTHGGGQALVLVALSMPLLFAVVALVIDGSTLMAQRRTIQNAADAASLAGAQELPAAGACSSTGPPPTCQDRLRTTIEAYSAKNGGPSTLDGGANPGHAWLCSVPSDTNCYTNPYVRSGIPNDQLVEVRLSKAVPTFFTGAIGLGSLFTVRARAVTSANPLTATTTTPGTTIAGSQDPNTTIPGATHTTTDPDIVFGNGGVAFEMSRLCGAISYTGAGAGGVPLGAFATNGGLSFSGASPKKVPSLLYDKTRCTANPPSPPSGTSACTATAWGNPPPDSNNSCVQTLGDLNAILPLPINWLLTPPQAPTPLPVGSTWTPSTDYPTKCVALGTGNITFTTAGHPPGIYCVTGATTSLTIAGLDLTTGDGYTFFALGGASIEVNGNPPKLKFYWPSACGARPTSRASFTCFGQTTSNYDPWTLLYATNPTNSGQ